MRFRIWKYEFAILDNLKEVVVGLDVLEDCIISHMRNEIYSMGIGKIGEILKGEKVDFKEIMEIIKEFKEAEEGFRSDKCQI